MPCVQRHSLHCSLVHALGHQVEHTFATPDTSHAPLAQLLRCLRALRSARAAGVGGRHCEQAGFNVDGFWFPDVGGVFPEKMSVGRFRYDFEGGLA